MSRTGLAAAAAGVSIVSAIMLAPEIDEASAGKQQIDLGKGAVAEVRVLRSPMTIGDARVEISPGANGRRIMVVGQDLKPAAVPSLSGGTDTWQLPIPAPGATIGVGECGRGKDSSVTWLTWDGDAWHFDATAPQLLQQPATDLVNCVNFA